MVLPHSETKGGKGVSDKYISDAFRGGGTGLDS